MSWDGQRLVKAHDRWASSLGLTILVSLCLLSVSALGQSGTAQTPPTGATPGQGSESFDDFLKSLDGQLGGRGPNQPKYSDGGYKLKLPSDAPTLGLENDPNAFPKKNFRLFPLAADWKRVDSSSNARSDLVCAFTSERGSFEVLFLESFGTAQFDNAKAIIEVKKYWLGMGWVTELLPDSVESYGSLKFQCARFANQGIFSKESHGVACTSVNGYNFRIFVVAKEKQVDHFNELWREVLGSFQVIDMNRKSDGSNVLAAQDQHSRHLGYQARWQDSKWIDWPTYPIAYPAAETGKLHVLDAIAVVIAIDLQGEHLTESEIEFAMLNCAGIDATAANTLIRLPFEKAPWKGMEFQARQSLSNGRNSNVNGRIMSDGKRAFCVFAATDTENVQREEILNDALQRIEILNDSRAGEKIYDASVRKRHGFFFNELSVNAFARKEFGKSAKFARKAFEFTPTNLVFLENAVQAHVAGSQYGDAIQLLEKNDAIVRTSTELMFLYASLLNLDERRSEAVKIFDLLFENDYRNEDHFATFMSALVKERQFQKACDYLERYRTQGDSTRLVAWHARALLEVGNPQKALEVCDSRAASADANRELALMRVDILDALERDEEALDLVKEIMGRQAPDADLWLRRSNLEIATGKVPQARETLEAAVKSFPQNSLLRQELTYVAGMLGKGANDSIKTRLEPVSIPGDYRFGEGIATREARNQTDSGAVYLQLHTAIAKEAGQRFRRTDYSEVMIIDRSGVENFSTRTFALDPIHERIYINELKVYDPSGSLSYEGDVDDFYVSDDASDMATYDKKVTAPISSLKPGSRIVTVVTREDLRPSVDFPYFTYGFFSGYPILEGSITVHADTKSLQVEIIGKIEAKQTESQLVFRVRNQPPLRFESLQPSANKFVPNVIIGQKNKNWMEIGDDYLELLDERLGKHASLKSLAQSITLTAKTRDEKIYALAEHVRDSLTYQALEFGRHAYVMESTERILKNKYGDCKDHSLLLHDLLNSMDIPTRLVLANTSGSVNTGFPSLDQFDHMIVAVGTSKGIEFIDPTSKYASPQASAVWTLGGEQVLVLAKNGSRLVEIPIPKTTELDFTSNKEVYFQSEGNIRVVEKVELRNRLAIGFRSMFASAQASSEVLAIQGMFAEVEPDIQVQAVQVQDLEERSKPLKIDLDYILPRGVKTSGNTTAGRLPSLWEKYFFSLEFASMRQTPFEWHFPLKFRSISKVTPGRGKEVRFEPQNQANGKDFALWRIRTAPTEKALEITIEAFRKPGQYEAKRYTECFDAMMDFGRAANDEFRVVEK